MLTKILKIKLGATIAVLVVIAILQLITGYSFGYKTEQILNQQFTKLTKSPYIIVNQYRYERGIFSSDLTATISLNKQAMGNALKLLPNLEESTILQNSYSISYKSHIYHGILAGLFHGQPVLTLAVANTQVTYPNPLNDILKKFFGNNQPLYITNFIYLNGNGKILIHSPQFNYEEALSLVKIKWNGLDLSSKYNQQFNQFNSQLDIPQFSFDAPHYGSILINNLHYWSDSSLSNNKIKVGTTNLTLDNVTLRFENFNKPKLMLGDLFKSLTGISAGEFLNGLDVINPTNFSLTGVAYATNSSDNGTYFNASANASFKSLITESNNYGPLNLNMSLNHILSKPFSNMIDELSVLSARTTLSDEQNKLQLINILKKYFSIILVDSPLINLKSFYLKTPQGEIKLNGNVTTKNFEASDINDQEEFFKKLVLNLDFSIPKNTLSYLFMLQMKYFFSAGNTAMDSQSAKALNKVVTILLNNQINSWKKRGYIKESGNVLSSSLLYQDGTLTMKP
jgi:uncharacterized protein YdgA (DUF945 family)